jgi:hypothetical protein
MTLVNGTPIDASDVGDVAAVGFWCGVGCAAGCGAGCAAGCVGICAGGCILDGPVIILDAAGAVKAAAIFGGSAGAISAAAADALF